MLRKKLKLDPVLSALNSKRNLTLDSSEVLNKNNNPSVGQNKYGNAPNSNIQANRDVAEQFLELESDLSKSLNLLSFSSVPYVYNPLEYAYIPHSVYIRKYCSSPKKILFVGMNPGPWGMCQTGVPFGEVKIVRDWFQIEEEVNKPAKECPEKPVLGFSCKRSEVSGGRLWGHFKNICGTPENFFEPAFMYNYCPLAFFNNTGLNITPDKIKGPAQKELEALCNKALHAIIQLLQVEILVGVGRFAEARAKEVLQDNNPLDTEVKYMPHPSPQAPGNWFEKADKFLNESGLIQYFKRSDE